MIDSIEQAISVQRRRVMAGKQGFAKSVRRCLKKNHADDYASVRDGLRVFWGRRSTEE